MAEGPETTTAEGEGTDSSDKPPHAGSQPTRSVDRRNVTLAKGEAPAYTMPSSLPPPSVVRGNSKTSVHRPDPRYSPNSIPLPPPETGALPKEPGLTKGDLGQLILQQVATQHLAGSETPSSMESPPDSESDGESWSPTSTRANTRNNSRAPSMSEERPRKPSFTSNKSAERQITHNETATVAPVPIALRESQASSQATLTPAQPRPQQPSRAPSQQTPSRPPSVHSDGGHKFTLKDLLANGPKLHRKSSARSSASSKKSDSDGDRRSTAGDSTASLSKKYGVCERLAIGKGATSIVRLAHKWNRTEENRTEEKLYAVKEFRKKKRNETEKEYVKKLTAEFCISSTLHHANIVETVDLVQDENKKWCEVMEFCPGGDLYAAIKKGGMSPSEVECCFKQILTGVSYLHSQGVAHRDIKPENLFFNARGQLKIGDYGASTVYRLPWETTVHMSTGLCGSEPYIAPEQFTNKPYDARLVDIWACGIVYYCLHFQELPWRIAQVSDPLYATYAQACASTTPAQSACPPTINNLSPRDCRALIRKMLEPDPKQRWTIEEVVGFSWVQKIEVCSLVAEPKHVHVCARQLADAQTREVASVGVGGVAA